MVQTLWLCLLIQMKTAVATLNADLSSPQQLAVYAYDPFDADVLARLRAGANEKGIVMRYVANLIKWGNRLFAQYTWETITEATMLYTESLDLLGPMPRQVGDVPAPVIQLGSAVLGALERQDAEQLALMQNNDEATILNLTTQIKQDQINGLEQTGQSLQAALSSAQLRQQTYATWLQGQSGSSNG